MTAIMRRAKVDEKNQKRRDGTREERTQIRAMRTAPAAAQRGAGIRSGGRGALRAAQRRAIRQASSTATLGTPESGPDVSLRRIKMASSKYRRSGLDTTITRREMPFTITVSAPFAAVSGFCSQYAQTAAILYRLDRMLRSGTQAQHQQAGVVAAAAVAEAFVHQRRGEGMDI